MATGNVTLRAVLTGTNAGMIRAFNESASASEATGQRISTAGKKGASEFSQAFEEHTTKVGGAFTKLGNVGSTFGLPFTQSLDTIGKKFDEATAKGSSFSDKMSAIGGITLAAGAAGFVALGAEAIHASNQFAVAQSALQSAVENTGAAWASVTPQINKTQDAMVGLGFKVGETDTALTTLVTASGSVSSAVGYMGLVADMARLKHISLTDAADALTKILAGNTRILATWGLNIDVTSGKLHNIQSAQDALATATGKLNTVQEQIANGHIKAANAAAKLAEANHGVEIATRNFHQAADSVTTVIDTLRQKTEGAAATFGQTFPGQIDRANAKLNDAAVRIGGDLTTALQKGDVALASSIDWFGKHKAVAEGLAGAIGGVLVPAMVLFVAKGVASMVTGTASAIGKLTGLTASATTASAEVAAADGQMSASNTLLIESFAELTAAVDGMTAQLAVSMGSAATETQTASGLIVVANSGAGASFGAMGAEATSASTVVAAADEAMVATTDAAAAEMDLAIGSTGVGLILIGLGVGVALLATHWHQSWHDIEQWTIDAVNKGIITPIDYAIDKINELGDFMGHIPKWLSGVIPGAGGFHISPINHIGDVPNDVIQPDVRPGVGPVPLAPGQPYTNQAGEHPFGEADNPYLHALADKQAIADAFLRALHEGNTGAGVGGGGGGAPTGMSAAERARYEIPGYLTDLAITMARTGPTDLIGQKPTVTALQNELTPENKASLDEMVSRLTETHDAALQKLADKLVADWASATSKLQSIIDADTNAGQNEVAKLQGAITSNSLDGLKNAVTGEAQVKFGQLVDALTNIHTQATDDLVSQLTDTFKQAQDQLASDLITIQVKADTDLAKNQATLLADQTRFVEDAARAQTQAVTDAASVMSTAMQAAANAITDASKVMTDASTAQTQAIADATTLAHDDASARTQAIQDASQTVVDTMAQRGLFGLNLIAQQQTVALDGMRSGFHSQIAAAQHSIDVVTADNHATVSQAQSALDQAVKIQDSLVAQAQVTSATVTQQSNAQIAIQQGQLDQVQRQTDAQVAWTAGVVADTQGKSQAQQQQEAAKLAQVQANQQLAVGQAQAALSGAQNFASSVNAQAAAALTAAQDQANQIRAAADAALQTANGHASVVLAQAQQALAQASDQAAVAEAQQQALINETREKANTQFAGSGLVVNITGLPTNDAAAIAAEMSWIARTQVANAG